MSKLKDFWKQLEEICSAHPKGKPYKDGMFYPDPTPIAPPVGTDAVADIDMFEVMRSRIRNETSIMAQMNGQESFEEADDFEIEDDFDPFSPWEIITEQFTPDGPVSRAQDSRPQPAPPAKEGAVGGGPPKSPPDDPPLAPGYDQNPLPEALRPK